MNNKKIMILGAGIYQLPLISKAKQMGYIPVVASIPGDYPGFDRADEVLYIDTTDEDLILEAAKDIGISGICTTGTDVAIRSLARVCDSMHLSGISYRAAGMVTEKGSMKEMFKASGVNTADFAICKNLKECMSMDLRFPVVVKAPDSSGSRGITVIHSKDDLKEACEFAASVSKLPYVVLEEFIEGEEIGLDAFIYNGEISIFLPHDKKVYRGRRADIPAGHSFPFNDRYNISDKLLDDLRRIIKYTGIDMCAINADIIIRDGIPYFLEIGGRAGGTCIPELISFYSGYDYYEVIIKAALGEDIDFLPFEKKPCTSRLIFADRDGRVESIDMKPLRELYADGIQVVIDVRPGDLVHLPQNGTDRIGHIVMPFNDDRKAELILERVSSCIVINPDNNGLHVPGNITKI